MLSPCLVSPSEFETPACRSLGAGRSDWGAVSMGPGGRDLIDSCAAPRYNLPRKGGVMPSWSIQALIDQASRMMMPGAWYVAGSGIMHK